MEQSRTRFPSLLPAGNGLYDASSEHDSCGIGFVVDIKGRPSHKIVEQGLTVLKNLLHRGACGAEDDTGDGAGILLQIPDNFLREISLEHDIALPKKGEYGTGIVFLPKNEKERAECKRALEKIIVEEGQVLLGWRDIPVDNSMIGPSAQEAQPFFSQVFIKII